MPNRLRRKYEKKILETIDSGFECDLLCAAFDNLDLTGPLRFNNFSYALRELLRHVLHRLANDEKVKSCSWFKSDKNAKSGITRAHRATYAVQGGLSDAFVTKKLRIDVATVRANLLSAIDVLNKHTHIEPSTFAISKTDARRLASECLEATRYFMGQIITCRSEVATALADAIDQHLLNHAISGTINSIDELATHHCIEGIYVEDIEVVDIGPQQIYLRVKGFIECELQYGSGSDVRNGLGDVMSTSFPLSANLTVQMERPLGKIAAVERFSVDTSSFYE